jgi:N-acylneuraminate cytidylyltransferase
MSVFAIIPARGGSKGVPKKNLHMLNGKPLLHYSISAALSSNLIDDVYVSSDDNEILEYATSSGARTILRPSHLSTDSASSESALIHFAENVEFDHLVFLQATSPLMTSEILDSAMSVYLEGNYDSVVSVFEDHGFWWYPDEPLYDPMNRHMRQENTNKKYKESGMFYITSKAALLSSKCRFSGKSHSFVHSRIVGYDIDDLDDFKIVEAIMEKLNV